MKKIKKGCFDRIKAGGATKLYSKALIMMSSFLSSHAALAVDSSGSVLGDINLGGVAHNIMSVEKSIHSLIKFICIASGVGLVIASLGLFYSHWQNPMNVPLSKPVSMFFLGFALIGLALIPMLMH